MNLKYHAQRTLVLEQMAALQTMELGSLKSEYREQPSGAKSGPYFKHQVWRKGANVTQRIAPEDAPRATDRQGASGQQLDLTAACDGAHDLS